MSNSKIPIVLYEPHQLRQLLYTHALERLGARVVVSATAADAGPLLNSPDYALAVISLSEDVGERQHMLSSMQRVVVTIPLVILDAEVFTSEHFSAMPVQAHFHRGGVNLSEVVSRIAGILHLE